MNYRFDEEKGTQAAAYLMKKHGGKINLMKLIKLLYLANRESLNRYLQPIVPDVYVSMRHGPVLSQLYNAITRCGDFDYWARFISERRGHDISLVQDPGVGSLNRRSLRILDEIDKEFHDADRFELVKVTHSRCPEWRDPGYSRAPIQVESILAALGKSKEEINHTIEEEIIFLKEAELSHGLELQGHDLSCEELLRA